MKRHIHLTALLLCLALFCAACGARLPDGEDAAPHQAAPIVVTEPERTAPVVVTEPSVSAGPDVSSLEQLPVEPDAIDAGGSESSAALPAGTEPGEDAPVPSAADLSGRYTDKQGTTEVYSDLTLTRREDGSYTAAMGLYRLAYLEGFADATAEGTLHFVSENPQVEAQITVKGGTALAEITSSGFDYICPGDVFLFLSGKE